MEQKMYAIIDTEGSGLFQYDKPADAEGQPRLASLAIIFADADFNIEREYHAFVRPDGWVMPEETTKIHGLTQDFLNEKGIPVTEVLSEYQNAVLAGRIIVAHNSQHDLKQLRAEFRRAGMDDLFEKTPNVCTMRDGTAVCKIPPNGNRGGYKWPKLSEAAVFFHIEEMGDHSALNDARVCLKIAQKLHALGKLSTPEVHYASDKNPAKPKDAPSRPRRPRPVEDEEPGENFDGTDNGSFIGSSINDPD